MYTYLILITLLFMIINLNYRQQDNALKVNFNFTCVIAVLIVLLAAFRGRYVGADTPSYMGYYDLIASMDITQIAERFKGYLGYYVPSKWFTMLGLHVSVWFGFVEIVYLTPLLIFIRRYSSNPLLSILIFITSGLFLFSLAGMKQTLAMGFMMMAYLLFIDKKYIWSAALIVLSYLTHPTVLVMLGGFILYYFRKSKAIYYIILAVLAITIFAGDWVLTKMVETLGNAHFLAYLDYDDTYSHTTLIFYSVIILIALLGYQEYQHRKPYMAKVALGFSVIACGLQSLSSLSPNAFRLAYLYTPYFMVFIPNCINSISNPNKRTVVYFAEVVCVCFYFLYITRNSVYTFS